MTSLCPQGPLNSWNLIHGACNPRYTVLGNHKMMSTITPLQLSQPQDSSSFKNVQCLNMVTGGNAELLFTNNYESHQGVCLYFDWHIYST